MTRGHDTIWPIGEETVRRQAKIFPYGAAARAVEQYEKRRAAGENVGFFEGYRGRESYIIVGPLVPTGDSRNDD